MGFFDIFKKKSKKQDVDEQVAEFQAETDESKEEHADSSEGYVVDEAAAEYAEDFADDASAEYFEPAEEAAE